MEGRLQAGKPKKQALWGTGNKFLTAELPIGELSKGAHNIELIVEEGDETGAEIDKMELRMTDANGFRPTASTVGADMPPLSPVTASSSTTNRRKPCAWKRYDRRAYGHLGAGKFRQRS